jgi:hypothetical protein
MRSCIDFQEEKVAGCVVTRYTDAQLLHRADVAYSKGTRGASSLAGLKLYMYGRRKGS